MLSNPGAYVYDCYGDLMIIMNPLYTRTGIIHIYRYEAVYFKATGEGLWTMVDNMHFTESGEVITVEENNNGYGDDNAAKAVYILLDPEAYGQEGYSNKTVAVYKK
jgi:hypothetical protein